MRHFAIVLPDGSEYFKDVPDSAITMNVCEEVVRKSPYQTSRRNPQSIKVIAIALEIKQGSLIRRLIGEYDIVPNIRCMTAAEYADEMHEILAAVPQEFRAFIEQNACDRGDTLPHKVDHARYLADGLAPCIDRYKNNLSLCQ